MIEAFDNSKSNAASSNSTCKSGTERILVVDDEPLNRAILSRLLSLKGYHPIEACCGEEALEILETTDVDLLLLDITMTGIDGFEVLRQIRLTKTEVELPVLMVTADTDRDQIIRAFQARANDYITKPIDVDIAIARIEIQFKLQRARAALTASEERFALSAKGTNDGLWDWQINKDTIYYSPRWKAMVGLAETDDISSIDDWFDRVHPEDRERAQSELQSHLRGDTPHFETQMRIRHTDGNFRWMLCRGAAIRDENGNATRIAGSLTDITEGKVADALTGLPNRFLFHDRLENVVEKNCGKADFAVFFLDLDDFKLVNDSLGHEIGDELLVAVARRLEGCVPTNDAFVARMGGDEFTILLDNVDNDKVERAAQAVVDSFKSPFAIGDGREVFTSVSLGISRPKSGTENVDDLLREADTAMYHAKAQGRSNYCAYDPAMKKKMNARLDLENDLREAVERGEIFLNYQPIVDIQTGKIHSFEALARWKHPQRGVVSPLDFIPIAEETGMIIPMGKAILELACQQLASWRAEFPALADVRMSVNVSSKQFAEAGLVDDIALILSQTQLPPSALTVEVTESTMMENAADTSRRLEQLRDRGIQISIDDFGTGFSSLASLHQLPLDVLKIDRSFVDNMLRASSSQAIVRAILSLAGSVNLDVIAEGIETEKQRLELMAMGCPFGQGYLFSHPLDASQIQKVLIGTMDEPSLFLKSTSN